jgi:hypothetical protein
VGLEPCKNNEPRSSWICKKLKEEVDLFILVVGDLSDSKLVMKMNGGPY